MDQIYFNNILNDIKNKDDFNFLILYYYGSFNPIHYGHINMLKYVYNKLHKNNDIYFSNNKKNNIVLGIYISITSDMSLKKKIKKLNTNIIDFVTVNDRIEMCKKVCKKYPYIMLYTLPDIDNYTSFDIRNSFNNYIHSILSDNIKIITLIGADIIQNIKNPTIFEEKVICISNRQVDNFEHIIENNQFKDQIIIFKDIYNHQISSTLIRSKIKKKELINDLTLSDIVTYIEKNKLYSILTTFQNNIINLLKDLDEKDIRISKEIKWNRLNNVKIISYEIR